MAGSQTVGRVYYQVEPVAAGWAEKMQQQTRGTGAKIGQQFSNEFASQTGKLGERTSRSFNFSGAIRSIGSGIGGAFSKVGSIGLKAIGGVSTAIIGLAAHGGFKRAMDIEGAQAKLKGLGHSTKDIKTLMDNALGAVKGTAFGLGEAASVAAGMSAAGVKSGADMSKSLKTIADTAAIAGMSMSDTGLIFESIAGRGKLMGDDMRQLTSRGIPVLDILGKKLGKTSAEVSAMVSKGQIDFQTFQDAMSDALGGSALAMGDTFAGKLANVKAALGRLGATAATPILDVLKTQLDAIIPAVDAFAGAVKPAAEALSKSLKPYADMAASSIENFSKKLQDGQITLGDIAANIAKAAGAFELFKVVGGNMPAIFDGILKSSAATGKALNGYAQQLVTVSGNPAQLFTQSAGSIKSGFTSISNSLGNVGMLFTKTGRDMLSLDGAFGRIPADFQKLADAGSSFANWQPFQKLNSSKLVAGFQAKIAPFATRAKSLWDAQTLEMLKVDGDPFAGFVTKVQAFNAKAGGMFAGLGAKVSAGLNPVKTAFSKVGDFMSPLTGAFGQIGGVVAGQMQSLGGQVFPLLGQLFSPGKIVAAIGFGGIAAALIAGLGALSASMGNTLTLQVNNIFAQVPALLQQASSFIQTQLPGMISNGMTVINAVLDGIITNLPQAFTVLQSGLTTLLDGLAAGLPSMVEKGAALVTNLITGITGMLPSLISSGIDIITGLLNGLINALPTLIAAAPTIILNLVNAIAQNLPQILNAGTSLLNNLVTGLTSAIPQLVAAVPKILQGLLTTITANLPKIVNSGVNLLVNLINGLLSAIPKLITAVPQIIGGIVMTLIRNFPRIIDAGSQILFSLLGGILRVIGNIPGTVVQIFTSIKNTLTGYDWGAILRNAGQAVINGFIDSVKAVWNNTKKFFSGIGDWIKAHKGPIAYDKRLLVPAGAAIMGGFQKSLNAGWAGVQHDVNSWNAQLHSSFTPFNANRVDNLNLQVQPTGVAELTQQVALLRMELPRVIAEYTPTVGRRDLARMLN